jgi:hypothetical protein
MSRCGAKYWTFLGKTATWGHIWTSVARVTPRRLFKSLHPTTSPVFRQKPDAIFFVDNVSLVATLV